MTKKYLLLVLLIVAGVASTVLVVRAQDATTDPNAGIEHIVNYTVAVDIHQDATIKVTENILYDFGQESKHGIFRTIPLQSDNGPDLKISNVGVTVDGNQATPFTVLNNWPQTEIKIGDPNKLIIGQHRYQISYEVAGAIRYFADYDEIYWNATGNDWEVLINQASAVVNLPQAFSPDKLKLSCYVGFVIDTTACDQVTPTPNAITFSQNQGLKTSQGLTVAVGFPKGVVAEPTAAQRRQWWFEANLPYLLLGGAILLVILAHIVAYFRRRQRPGTIVAEYDPPPKLSPSEASFLIHLSPRETIAADLIHLAVGGYLKISKISETNYLLERLTKMPTPASPVENDLLTRIFGDKQSVDLAHLADEAELEPSDLVEDVVAALTDQGLLAMTKKSQKYLSGLASGAARFAGRLFILVWLLVFSSVILGVFFHTGNSLPQPLSAIVWAVLIIWLLFPRRALVRLTPAGATERDYLLGLKLYIGTAEADRLKFANAPEKNPERFDALLPFAMIFGLEKEWAKKFEDLYQQPPTWYHDDHFGTAFSAGLFASHLSGFSSATRDTFSPVSSSGGFSSGSGGGGSSGGGSGGGGGGSW